MLETPVPAVGAVHHGAPARQSFLPQGDSNAGFADLLALLQGLFDRPVGIPTQGGHEPPPRSVDTPRDLALLPAEREKPQEGSFSEVAREVEEAPERLDDEVARVLRDETGSAPGEIVRALIATVQGEESLAESAPALLQAIRDRSPFVPEVSKPPLPFPPPSAPPTPVPVQEIAAAEGPLPPESPPPAPVARTSPVPPIVEAVKPAAASAPPVVSPPPSAPLPAGVVEGTPAMPASEGAVAEPPPQPPPSSPPAAPPPLVPVAVESPVAEAAPRPLSGAGRTVSSGGAVSESSISRAMRSQPAPPNSDRVEFVERLMKAARLTQFRGQVRLRIVLNPPHLGSVKVDLAMKDHVLQGTLQTETAAAREAIQSQLPQLRNLLHHQGIQVGDFTVDVREGFAQARENLDGGASGASIEDRAAEVSTEEAPRHLLRSVRHQLIDMVA